MGTRKYGFNKGSREIHEITSTFLLFWLKIRTKKIVALGIGVENT